MLNLAIKQYLCTNIYRKHKNILWEEGMWSAVRVIPSDSEDGKLDWCDSKEEWTPESGLKNS